MRFGSVPLPVIGLAVIGTACGMSHPGEPDSSTDSGAAEDAVATCDCGESPEVDVLLVLPDQAAIRSLLEQTILDLASQVMVPVAEAGVNVHVGLLSSDLGVGGETVPLCSTAGDEGVLLRRTGESGYLAVDAFEDATGVTEALVSRLSFDDCGFEQPLEATLKAIATAADGLEFHNGNGEGDRSNSGFVRSNSTLAIVHVAVENDCSSVDEELYSPSSTEFDTILEQRCVTYPEVLRPLERYSDAFSTLSSGSETLFYFLGGIPVDLDGVAVDGILADPRMAERIDPDHPTLVQPACSPETANFAPARRQLGLVQQLASLGKGAGFASLCGETSPVDSFGFIRRELLTTACACSD